ncbi:MAG: diguanylate cyclase [Pseudomonadota bacterium]
MEKTPAKLIAMSSIASLALIAALAIFVYVTVREIVNEQSGYATKINISGQQRMLSQRAAFFATEYAKSAEPSDRQVASESIARLNDNHAFLLSAHRENLERHESSPLSPQLAQLFFESPYKLDERIKAYVALVEAVLAGNPDSSASVTALKTQSQQILVLFDRVVKQYEIESQQKVTEITDLQKIIFAAILLYVLFQIFVVVRPLLSESERLTHQLRDEANRDYLTGLYNRRIFRDLANQALTLSLRNNQPASLMLFDIDDFKSVNDRFGHAVGDNVIRLVADTILAGSRKSDEVFRFGGEEFVVVLPETGADGAERVAEKIRESIQELSGSAPEWPCPITVSGGIATLAGKDHDLEGLLRSADTALYRAKSLRKNRVVAA